MNEMKQNSSFDSQFERNQSTADSEPYVGIGEMIGDAE
jgi:hypothetical protein